MASGKAMQEGWVAASPGAPFKSRHYPESDNRICKVKDGKENTIAVKIPG